MLLVSIEDNPGNVRSLQCTCLVLTNPEDVSIMYIPPLSWYKCRPSYNLGENVLDIEEVGLKLTLHPNGLKCRILRFGFSKRTSNGVILVVL